MQINSIQFAAHLIRRPLDLVSQRIKQLKSYRTFPTIVSSKCGDVYMQLGRHAVYAAAL